MTSSQSSRPGKLAPFLYQNFLAFDPTKSAKPNILVDTAPPAGEGPQLAPGIGSCKHEFTLKPTQSVPPPLDLRPTGDEQYKLAVVCRKCRIHADILIDHSNGEDPCCSGVTSSHPLHHFQSVTSLELATADRIRYVWRCSVSECRATLFIHYRRPRLHDNELSLLVDPELLKRRYDALMAENPEREGIRVAKSEEALQRLRRYISDSLNPDHARRQFPSHNKRFQEAFGIDGQDCSKLLMRLGFKYDDHSWTLPNPSPITDRLQTNGDSHREILEDVELELLAYQHKLSVEHEAPPPAESWSSANADIERIFGAQGYNRHVSQRRGASGASHAELAYFNGLGALPELSDSLVEYAFDRQILCDPERQGYYFECLQVITEARQTEQLQTKVATLASQDVVSRRDVSAAYRYLSINARDGETFSDDRVLGLFQAQQSDLGQQGQEVAREHLYKIGVYRQSQLLINASRQSIESYEDALSWLGNGVGKETPDEGLLAVVSIKTDGNPANEEVAKKAISVIARARKSNLLDNWLTTGRTDGYSMTVDEALRHLGFEQSISELDKELAQAIFTSAREDRPGETTNKACGVVWQALMEGTTASRSPATWPVGLTSHGNTCYLNSLLQYYFSIKPLRDIVLHYDDYKLDTSTHVEKDARVGQRKVKIIEIKGGQRFAQDLKHLFERMITSPETSVKPEEDLVCRAFLDPIQYALLDPELRRDSTADQTTANGADASNDAALTDGEVLASPTETLSGEAQSSGASSVTLQASVNGEDTDVPMKDIGLPPTPPASPGLKGGGQEISHPTYGPPPLPPRRRFSTTKEEALSLAKQKAKEQQDVTEVHDAAMFRLRCGMTPQGIDDAGEQNDQLRDLFSVVLEQTVIKDGIEDKPVTVYDSNIQLNVPHEPTNIYSALDDYFDRQPYGDNTTKETFKSIRTLPPLLQINIPRIGFDEETGGAFKSNHSIRLEDELYLDRYYGHDRAATMERRRQCWERRKRLRSLKMEKKIVESSGIELEGHAVLAQSASFLSSLDAVNQDLQAIGIPAIEADGDITDALAAESEKQAKLVSAYQIEIDNLQKYLDAEFADDKTTKYRLAAVFFHRGQHGHGHYWIYIHDFANNVWRIYNDERVDEFNKMTEIFEAKTFNDGTPTYAVYVDASKLDMVEAVCRKVDTPSANDANNGTADPRELVVEGGESWDSPREVANTAW